MTSRQDISVAIIGAGFSGLCMAIKLQEAGFHNYRIYEKSDGFGGTWRGNTYPGAACDIPSFLYCYSFEQKKDWSLKFSPQPEILEYIETTAKKYGVDKHAEFNTEISSATWSETENCWRIETASGKTFTASVLISGCGQLNQPWTPEIPGLDSFAGTQFHSARWNHEHDLAGKKVAVIGNGASAIQFVPHVIEKASEVTIFQRSANWIMTKKDKEYGPVAHWLFKNIPGWAKLYRLYIYFQFESRFSVLKTGSWLSRFFNWYINRDMDQHIERPALEPLLKPDYTVGCKRILQADTWFPAIQKNHVGITDSHIQRVTENSIVTEDGKEYPVDTIIFGTGFKTTEFLTPMTVTGRNGQALGDAWSDGAEAYNGVAVSGFPNFYLLYGPNTNLGHNSIIFMIENEVKYIIRCLDYMFSQKISALDVRPAAMSAFNQWVQQVSGQTVWSTACESWYKNESGKITNNWPESTLKFRKKLKQTDFSDFDIKMS